MIDKLKKDLILFARIFGFCYPSKVVNISDTTTGKSKMIENFQITSAGKRQYVKSEQHQEKEDAKNTKNGNNKKKQTKPYDEDEQEDVIKDLEDMGDKGFSMLTDLNTKEDFRIAGRIETMFRGRRPADVFQLTSLAVFLPVLIITEVWQLFTIYNIPVDPVISATLGTFFLMLTVHNARYCWGSSVQVLYVTKKTSVGGADIYIPNMIEFLNFKQSKVKDLRDDLMAMLNAEIRPLRNENAKLNATLENLYKSIDKAKQQGRRDGLTFANSRLSTFGPYWVTIVIFIAGVLLGWFMSGGVGIVQNTNATAMMGG